MLQSENRLRRQKDFDYVYKRGQLIVGPVFNLKVARNELPVSRIGFVVSKKTEKHATGRNLVKRRLRAAVSEVLPSIQTGFDIVISIKGRALNRTYAQLMESLLQLLTQAKLLQR